MDAVDRELQALRDQEERKQKEYQLQSQVIQRNLPRPVRSFTDEQYEGAEKMIFETMRAMIENDDFNYPVPGRPLATKPTQSLQNVSLEMLQ